MFTATGIYEIITEFESNENWQSSNSAYQILKPLISPLFAQREMSQIERPLVTFKLSEWVVVLGFDLANCLYSQRMKVSENKTMTFAKSYRVNLCTWLANLID
jgi:hypothetical protein